MKTSPIRLGTREVGTEHPPFVIAEMSGNHNGTLAGALRIVEAAADSGAHAVKLQTYTPATLTIDSHRPEFFIEDPQSLWNGRRLWELYAEAHTPWEWHKPIFDLARKRGLSCISSAFDLSSVEFLVSLGVDAIKIASFELVHIPLIEAAARTKKPLLLSTGMATKEEIQDAVSALRANGCEQFILLKCTSAYPSVESDANNRTISDMRERYQCQIGISDHALGPHVSLAAVALGATVVEKHFMIARSEGGVDCAFSLEPREMQELVEGTKMIWETLGRVHYGTLSTEDTSRKERPSIYVVRPIHKGETFTAENVRIIRPGNGLAPKFLKEVIGQVCTQELTEAVPMSWDYIQRR